MAKQPTRKKTTAARPQPKHKAPAKTGRPAGKKPPAKKPARRNHDVAVLVTLGIAVLLYLGVFDAAGVFGSRIHDVLFGIFGSLAYVFPLLFVLIVFYLLRRFRTERGRAVLKAVGIFVLFAVLCGLAEFISGRDAGIRFSVAEFYRRGDLGFNGGALGGLLFNLLHPVLGTVGGCAVLIFVGVICFVLVSGTTLFTAERKKPVRQAEMTKTAARALQKEREQTVQQREAERKARSEAREAKHQARRTQYQVRTVRMEAKRAEAEAKRAEAEARKQEALRRLSREGGPRSMEIVNLTHPDAMRSDRGTPEFLQKELAAQTGRPEAGQPEGKAADTPAVSEEILDKAVGSVIVAKDRRTLGELDALDRKETGAEETDDAWDAFLRGNRFTAGKTVQPSGDEMTGRAASGEKPSVSAEEPEEEDFRRPEEILKKLESPAAGGAAGTVSAARRDTSPAKTAASAASAPAAEEPKKEPNARAVLTARANYKLPPLSLLTRAERGHGSSREELRSTAEKLQKTFRDFGIGVTVTNISCGPSVTRYEVHPDQGVKVSRIVALTDDIKLNLAATDIRIEAPIPGKDAVGIEVPNTENQMVSMREMLESEEFRRFPSKLAFAVGRDVAGKIILTDLARMPHLLIAGATGSGKSVCINTLIMSILFKARPEEVKLIMIDPKMVELAGYNGIPHLFCPVVTDPKKAAGALNWAVAEMAERYQKFADLSVRDIRGYNKKVEESGDPELAKMPQIVVIVDELADLMMVEKHNVEDSICRLAQLARAAGIHLVLATQRPSVDVITGLIKANIPSRIAFQVSSGVDSRTILDMNGAERLLGKGDMLFAPSNLPKPVRVQGSFVSDEEVAEVVRYVISQCSAPAEINRSLEQKMQAASSGNGGSSEPGGEERDSLFVDCGRYVIESEKASIGNLQRRFRIGFNRAARIMDQLADCGVVSQDEGTKARQILMSPEQFEALLEAGEF